MLASMGSSVPASAIPATTAASTAGGAAPAIGLGAIPGAAGAPSYAAAPATAGATGIAEEGAALGAGAMGAPSTVAPAMTSAAGGAGPGLSPSVAAAGGGKGMTLKQAIDLAKLGDSTTNQVNRYSQPPRPSPITQPAPGAAFQPTASRFGGGTGPMTLRMLLQRLGSA